MKRSSFIILSLFLFSSYLFSFEKDKVYRFTILHTNDHHGRFWHNEKQEYGLAARATLIKKLRKELSEQGVTVFLVDAGDVNTGAAHSNIFNAQPDFLGMAQLEYDLMAVGNHEFDNSWDVLQQQMLWAGFPFLSANIYNRETGLRVFSPSLSKTVDDLKISFMGLTTEDTPIKSNPQYTAPFDFRNPVDEAKLLVPQLKKESDVVVAVTHMGHYENENHGSDAPGDVTLARQVDGIDVIVGGHTNSVLMVVDIQNNTYIAQAGDWGKYVGRLDFEFLNGELKLVHNELVPVNLKKKVTLEDGTEVLQHVGEILEADQTMLNLLTPFKEAGDESMKEFVVNNLSEFISVNEISRHREYPLGNLIAKAYQTVANADLTVINSGGIRAGLPQGDLILENVLTVLPFGNFLATCEFNSRELHDYLEYVFLNLLPGSGSFPQTWGISATVFLEKRKIIIHQINGEEFNKEDLSKRYILALTDFQSNGGDGYPRCQAVSSGYTDSQAFFTFLKKLEKLDQNDYLPTGNILRI